jgi:hypothetical protein
MDTLIPSLSQSRTLCARKSLLGQNPWAYESHELYDHRAVVQMHGMETCLPRWFLKVGSPMFIITSASFSLK